ncbi:ABC-2 type transport system ATP-binding protein [Murinocardiopsis flavida]|uniref:ABC-2 type transport system ATP-binding protein n=1 Tax=Murinocardiopsis flavida TaxID=645275 RepID=A0A2P8DMZ2_9ACTN|nr:ABC transporter ATP-binding protein [Murinocardiopsis flavida]PSK98587.1 ABC-2 type transport system ATP-binding protein [Murinocardiopsis flavida]
MSTRQGTDPRGEAADPTPAPGAARSGAAIEVRDLRQRYGDFEAVRGVSFDVAPGELFALLGTNGAGKTTTIETLEGFRRPSGGAVRIFGTDPYGRPAGLRDRMNAVLQQSGLLDDLTVAETIDLARALAAAPRGHREVLDRVELADKSDVAVRALSGGQKRRLDLGLAILTRPEVLFLDEPTSGMDPEMRRATWQVIADLIDEGVAVLLTTHYLEEAERLADRLAIMHRGEIRVAGALSEVLGGWGDRIGFRLPPSVRSADLPSLSGAVAAVGVRGGEPWASYAVTGSDTDHRAHTAVAELLRWAHLHQVALGGLEVRTASLEDVFLRVADGAADLVGD